MTDMRGRLPLSLGVTRLSPETAGAGLDEATHQKLYETVLTRDDQCCGFCGFRAARYQDIECLGDDPSDPDPDNWVTICLFCQQCRHLETVAEMRSGSLIWLPELGQAELHAVCRAIYIARITSGPMADAARVALDALMLRREGAKARLGSDEPGVLAAVMQDLLEDHEYADSAEKLDGIRLLPHDRRVIKEGDLEFNQFPQILAYWRSKNGPFGGMMPSSWFDLFDQVNSQMAEATAAPGQALAPAEEDNSAA